MTNGFEMPTDEIKCDAARIEEYKIVRGPNESPIDVYLFEDSSGIVFFELYFEFAENRTDFWVRVENFGLTSEWAAGSTNGFGRRGFSSREAEKVKLRLEAFFREDQRENRKASYAFGAGGKCLGTKFPTGWISTK
jgi:hypothetical protein